MSHIVFSNSINAIELWSNKWQLPLAVSKCTWMLLSNRIEINRPSYSFIMAGLELDGTDEIKDLGVIFNSKLGFDGHIDNMVARAKQRLFLLKKSFVSKDSSVLIFAFKTYILPLLDYCSPVWSPFLVTDVLRIESIQRSFTKSLAICPKNTSYKDRLAICELTSLEYRRLLTDLILFYKIINNLVSIDLRDTIIPYPPLLKPEVTPAASRSHRPN